MPRSPSGARAPSDARMLHAELGLADVERANRHAARRHAVDQPACRRCTAPLPSARPARPPASRNSDRKRPMPSAPRSRARTASSGDSTLASSRICTPSSVTGGSRRYPSSVCSYAARRCCRPLTWSSVGRVGIDEHVAGRAVHREQRPGLNDRAGVVQPGDGRHVDRARQDRRVIRPAPRVGDDRGEALPVELGDHRRRQLVGHEHERALEVLEQGLEELDRIAAAAQVHAQAPDDVADVSLALAQVRVFGPIEQRRDFAERAFAAPTRR